LYPPLIEFTYDPGTNHMERDDELRAQRRAARRHPERYAPDVAHPRPHVPRRARVALKHILGPPTTTAGDGVITDPDAGTIPVGAFRHVWDSTNANWGNPGRVSPLTRSIAAFKDQGEFVKLKGCGVRGAHDQHPGDRRRDARGERPGAVRRRRARRPVADAGLRVARDEAVHPAGLSLPTFLRRPARTRTSACRSRPGRGTRRVGSLRSGRT
jgi:hypothetical protein